MMPLCSKYSFVLALSCVLCGSVWAIDYKSIEPTVAILYDAPSSKGKRLFLLRRLTPVEVVVSLEAFVKIREPEGALGWVDKKSLTDKRTVLITLPKAQIRVKADAAAAVLFEAEKGVALDLLESLPDGWAKVRHLDGTVGFVRSTQAWGI